MGKDAIKKSGTLIANIGQGTLGVHSHVIIDTNIGQRDSTGITRNILQQQTTDNECNLGNIIKYVNLCIEIGPRTDAGQEDNNNGWLEYGIVKYKETFIAPETNSLGTNTLGDNLTKNFRGDVLWTGCLPCGSQQPNAVDLRLKIPKILLVDPFGII